MYDKRWRVQNYWEIKFKRGTKFYDSSLVIILQLDCGFIMIFSNNVYWNLTDKLLLLFNINKADFML